MLSNQFGHHVLKCLQNRMQHLSIIPYIGRANHYPALGRDLHVVNSLPSNKHVQLFHSSTDKRAWARDCAFLNRSAELRDEHRVLSAPALSACHLVSTHTPLQCIIQRHRPTCCLHSPPADCSSTQITPSSISRNWPVPSALRWQVGPWRKRSGWLKGPNGAITREIVFRILQGEGA